MEAVVKSQQDKEDQELTLKPKTLTKTNQKLLARRESEKFTTGDHNLDLYLTSKVHEKKNRNSEEYYYEKNKEECVFKPKINTKAY